MSFGDDLRFWLAKKVVEFVFGLGALAIFALIAGVVIYGGELIDHIKAFFRPSGESRPEPTTGVTDPASIAAPAGRPPCNSA